MIRFASISDVPYLECDRLAKPKHHGRMILKIFNKNVEYVRKEETN